MQGGNCDTTYGIRRGFGVWQRGWLRQQKAADTRQRCPGKIRAGAIPHKQDFHRAQGSLLQKKLEQLTAALLHPVLAGNEHSIQKIQPAFLQHGFDLLFRQIHIRNRIYLLPAGMAGRSGLGYRSVGGNHSQFRCALCSGVSTPQGRMCINFGQRHLAAKGLAGFCLCGNARPGKAESRLMGNFHQGEQIRRAGAIPLEQGIENIKSNRFVPLCRMQQAQGQAVCVWCIVHCSCVGKPCTVG